MRARRISTTMVVAGLVLAACGSGGTETPAATADVAEAPAADDQSAPAEAAPAESAPEQAVQADPPADPDPSTETDAPTEADTDAVRRRTRSAPVAQDPSPSPKPSPPRWRGRMTGARRTTHPLPPSRPMGRLRCSSCGPSRRTVRCRRLPCGGSTAMAAGSTSVTSCRAQPHCWCGSGHRIDHRAVGKPPRSSSSLESTQTRSG